MRAWRPFTQGAFFCWVFSIYTLMARPERNNVDYFPFYCEEGKKMYYLEETYGNDGFAVFLKILRELAKTDYHFLDISKKTTLMFLSVKCKVSKEILLSIINDLVELDKFDFDLWTEHKVIWCKDFIDSIQDAYSKRKNNCITKEGLLRHLQGLEVLKPSKLPLKGGGNPQSIEEYTKEEKSISLVRFEFLFKNYYENVKKAKEQKENAGIEFEKLTEIEKNKALLQIENYSKTKPEDEHKYLATCKNYLSGKLFNNEFAKKDKKTKEQKMLEAYEKLQKK